MTALTIEQLCCDNDHKDPSPATLHASAQQRGLHVYHRRQSDRWQTQSRPSPNVLVEDEAAESRWGRTKAGKRRKRSARACVRCQEKKIRCDWNGSCCTPCVRASKRCHCMTLTAKAGQRHCDNPTPRQESLTNTIGSRCSDHHTKHATTAKHHLSQHDEHVIPDAAVEVEQRHMAEHDEILGTKHQIHPGATVQPLACLTHQAHPFACNVDPVLVDSDLVKHHIWTFEHVINCGLFQVFPPKSLMRWALDQKCKNIENCILLYALLALATALRYEQDHTRHRDLFIHIVREGLNNIPTQYSLITVLVRLYLVLALHAQERFTEACEVFGIALLAINWLQLRTEPYKEFEEQPILNLSESSYLECRRRTFWMVFTTNTYIFSGQHQLATFNTAGIFLRCPCTSEEYAEDDIPATALVDFSGATDMFSLGCRVSLAVIHLVAICDEIREGMRRACAAMQAGREMHEAECLQGLEKQLQTWARRWLSQAQSNQHPGSADQPYWTYVELLYSYAAMSFYRFQNHGKLAKSDVACHQRAVHLHAQKILELVGSLYVMLDEPLACSLSAITFLITSNVVFEALDVISATIMIHDVVCDGGLTMQLIYKGLEALNRFAQYWSHARRQQTIAQKRSRVIFSAATQAAMRRKVAIYCTHSMMAGVVSNLDLVYNKVYKERLNTEVAYQEAFGKQDVEEIDTSNHAVFSSHV